MEALVQKVKSSLIRGKKPVGDATTPPPRKKIVHIDPRLNAPVEQLPPEVRRQLLSTLDLDSLRATIRASPVYYQQYRLDQRRLLGDCLDDELRSVAVDACAVQQSISKDFSLTRSKGSIPRFLKSYHERRCSNQHMALAESLTAEDALQMVIFHTSIIRPLVRKYTQCALDNISRDCNRPSTRSTDLSHTEQTRLLRAFYRIQLFCNLFGLRHSIKPWDTVKFPDTEILHMLFSPMNPWEVEEINCVASFVKERYNHVFDDIASDIHPDNSRFDDQHRPPTPDGSFDLQNSWRRSVLLQGVCCHGLEFLHTVLFKIDDREKLIAIMQKEMQSSPNTFPGGDPDELLSDTPQYFRRQQWPSEQDTMTTQRIPLPFRGDAVDSPPLGWTILWRGTYSNVNGWFADKELGRWGYVIWDAERFERSGAKDNLQREVDSWGDQDPRVWAGV